MDFLLAQCSSAFSSNQGIFTVFFLGGLMGSITHCLVMCGPTVACQAACGGNCGKRLDSMSQWHYHLGRFLTYGIFGFLVALLSRSISVYPFWPTLSSFILVFAGILFLASAVFPGRHSMLSYKPKNYFFRGVLMSFMPCGLLYAALMMAATLANPISGMLAMFLFVLGTLPALLFASTSAAILASRWSNMIGRVGRFGMAFNGLALLAMAARVVR